VVVEAFGEEGGFAGNGVHGGEGAEQKETGCADETKDSGGFPDAGEEKTLGLIA
jgi:hypothetical protein